MLSQQSSLKKREYEKKIIEFMAKSEQSDLTHQPQSRRESCNMVSKTNTQKPMEQSFSSNPSKKFINDSSKSSLKRQESSRNPSNNRSKTLNRKTTSIPQIQEQQEIPFSQNHKILLQKIEYRICQMNQKISQQISNEQNALLNEYAEKLKSKQEELNRLRLITNQEMINEKTIERKEQLKREKENLIQGNHYYNEKLEELKKQFNRLTELREFQRKNLNVLMLDQPLELQQIEKQTSQGLNLNRSRTKPIYFSSQDYVQKVLQKYNQKSQIINQSLTQSSFKKSQSNMNTQSRKYESFLPKILEKNSSLKTSKSINPEQEFYSYRKMKKKIDRAKSTGVFDNMDSSIDSKMESSEKGVFNSDKLNKFFRYNNKLSSNNQTKDMSGVIKQSKTNEKSKRISNTQEILMHKKEAKNNFQFTKEYLEQFVVKKTIKQLVPKNVVREKNEKSLENLKEKEKVISEKLEPQLKIEALFRAAADEYYRFKQKQKKLKTEQSLADRKSQQKNDNESNQITQTPSEIDKKKTESLMQMKQFDKKIIMDLMLNHYNFKRYLYELIVNAFESGNSKQNELNLQSLIKNFDSSAGIYRGKS